MIPLNISEVKTHLSRFVRGQRTQVKRASLLLLLFAAAVLLAPPLARASVIFISADDNGHEFTFVRGDALEISLPATSGTGYTWQAEPVAGSSVKQMGEPDFKRDGALPGASGLQVFHFAVGKSGSGTIELRYMRPWEKSAPAARIFKIKFTIS
jgi:predicted secreted protein